MVQGELNQSGEEFGGELKLDAGSEMSFGRSGLFCFFIILMELKEMEYFKR